MEILEQKLEIDHENLANANFLIIEILRNGYTGNRWGYPISRVKLKNGNVYIIALISNEGQTILNELVNFTDEVGKVMDYDLLREYFLNGMNRYLKFSSEAYIRIINEKDPEEIKIIFTDYYEALEYLESLEK
jgi:hypothetical protein